MKIKATIPAKQKPALPFSFIFDYLYPLEYTTKPMFGCRSVYINDKIVLILRERSKSPELNGIWIATERKHHESLRELFPSMKSILALGRHPTNWQMIHEAEDDFEASAILLCKLIKQGDVRIGKIPKKERRKSIEYRAGSR